MTALDADIAAMTAGLAAAAPIYQPSRFWTELNRTHLDQLQRLGFANFKRTVNQTYFNWLPRWRDNQFAALRRHWWRGPALQPWRCRLAPAPELERWGERDPLQSAWARRCYGWFVGLLWAHARRGDRLRLLDRLAEPELGNPLCVRWRGKLISQDLANSVRELYALLDHGRRALPSPLVVAELGAGYGRLHHPLHHALQCRSWIFDIPPALAIAQRYLGELFPQARVFRFRAFRGHADVAPELAASDFAFFTPDQLELLPDRAVHCFVNISSLHEMRRDQIEHLLLQMQRLCSERIYLKQWLRSDNRADGIVIERADYRLGPDWRIALDRKDDVQDRFFELVAERSERA